MLKPKQVEQAIGIAIVNIKRTKKMEHMRYPLLDKRGYHVRFYFTNTTGAKYTNIIKLFLNRKRTKVEADGLYCFEFNHKQDSWFIEDVNELAEYIQVMFNDYYNKYVK